MADRASPVVNLLLMMMLRTIGGGTLLFQEEMAANLRMLLVSGTSSALAMTARFFNVHMVAGCCRVLDVSRLLLLTGHYLLLPSPGQEKSASARAAGWLAFLPGSLLKARS